MPDWKEMGLSRYRVYCDNKKGFFAILDVWHDSIKNIPENELDQDKIPDNSPALKILSNEEVGSLIEELKRLGWFDKIEITSRMGWYTKLIRRIFPIQKTPQEVAIKEISRLSRIKSKKYNQKAIKEAIFIIREIAEKV